MTRPTGGATDAVNVGYDNPLTASERTQDGVLLFACGRDRAITLVGAFLATAGYDVGLAFLWSKPEQRAGDLPGKMLELSVAKACRGQAFLILTHEECYIGDQRFEFDAAVRDDGRIVLIKTKGKTPTRQSPLDER